MGTGRALSDGLIAQWHPTRNDRAPTEVTSGSGHRAWWQCELGHEWQTAVRGRSQGSGCPYCAGRQVLPGFNDLATVDPDRAAEWHPTRNAQSAKLVTRSSSYRAWWVCPLGHEWQQTVNNRDRGTGCPDCSGQRTRQGFNDLSTHRPDLAAEWHPTKNTLTPQEVTARSGHRAWWQCELGHEWQAAVGHRSNGSGCRVCSGQQAHFGFNDLGTLKPDLASEWHPTKNNLSPMEVTTGAAKKAWWRCPLGHEWRAAVYSRVSGKGCPCCAGRILLTGFNDLATVAPDIASEWHPTRNAGAPAKTLAGAVSRAWWQCVHGHEWQAPVERRSARLVGCPTCAGRVVEAGFNDLASRRPDLSAQWHPDLNKGAPSALTTGSNQKVWWRCPSGHEWQATVSSRVGGNGCPSCATYGFNPERPAVVYLLRHRSHQAYKIGIANAGGTRLQQLETGGWDEEASFSFRRGKVAATVERAVLRWVRDELQRRPYMTPESMPRGGYSETFASADLPVEKVVERIRSAIIDSG